ncbi:MAG: M48 family metallopeptidase [Dehalococcoidia bacterium]|nr:M48 family metallopeptidase [Dehalococcoidia bacterium]
MNGTQPRSNENHPSGANAVVALDPIRRQPTGTGRTETRGHLTIEVAGAPVTVTIVRSRRRRRTIAIAVEAATVVVRAPMASTDPELIALLRRRTDWIAGRMSRAPAVHHARPLVSGATVPYRGQALTLNIERRPIRRSAVGRHGDTLHVQVPSSIPDTEHQQAVHESVARWYRARAVEVIPDIVSHWSAVSGLEPARVLVRDQRRRWGSCGPDGTVRFNWRLILLDPRLAEYVVVHELAHLRHRNHQAPFWQEVSRLLPDHLERRRNLTAAGRELVV